MGGFYRQGMTNETTDRDRLDRIADWVDRGGRASPGDSVWLIAEVRKLRDALETETYRADTAAANNIALRAERDRLDVRVQFVAFETPAHALAEVALWRGIVERHGDHGGASNYRGEPDPALCHGCAERWPCPDLLAVVAAARAYMGAS